MLKCMTFFFTTGVLYIHAILPFPDLYFSFSLPFPPCGLRLDLESLKNMYAMAFAVQEINRNSTLLPGVKLGYRIADDCSRYPWALQEALSLVGGDTNSCRSTASVSHSASYEPSGETSVT